jgi:hypothetical protein
MAFSGLSMLARGKLAVVSLSVVWLLASSGQTLVMLVALQDAIVGALETFTSRVDIMMASMRVDVCSMGIVCSAVSTNLSDIMREDVASATATNLGIIASREGTIPVRVVPSAGGVVTFVHDLSCSSGAG